MTDKREKQKALIKRNKQGETWTDIALSLSNERVSITSAGVYRFATSNYEPSNTPQRLLLGLEPKVAQAEIVCITQEIIISGTQILESKQCECGYYFVPNVPNRKRCYLCSPSKAKKHE